MEHDGHTPSTGGDDHLELPPGFRFHPTDEELITHYLAKKVADREFSARAIGEVDFNKCEPWEFPWRAKMGEKEWFFFSVRDRKYPTGLRTNRATDSGYWKATGKDKEIRGGRSLVGMKKTLVFYLGRAPKGEKSNWIMHEYRLDGKLSCCSSPRWSSEIEWVICRVFRKGLGLSTAMGSTSSPAGEPRSTPPLVDVRPGTSASRKTALLPRVFSFDEKIQMEKMVQGFAGPALFPSSAAAHCYSNMPRIPPLDGAMRPPQREGCKAEREGGGSQSQETGLTCEMIPEISSVLSSYEVHRPWFEDHAAPPTDLVLDDCIWN